MTVLADTVRGRWFWPMVVALEGLVLLVGLRSPLLAVLLALGIGMVLFLALAFGSRQGTFVIAVALVVIELLLPGELAIQARLPVGGGGIFIVDFLLALLIASWLVRLLFDTEVSFVRSPVTLPLILFLAWVGVTAVLGFMSGNGLKYILQDARGLAYYVVFLWGLSSIRSRADVDLWMRILTVCVFAGFGIGIYYSLLGKGMALTYVEGSVSRFPAPNEVFVISTALATTFVVIWPPGRRRPFVLWAVLLLSMTGVMLAFVRGYWLGLAVGFVYLLLVLRIGERLRLLGGGLAVLALLGGVTFVVRPTLFESVVTRASAVSAYDSDPSVQYRLIENRAAMAQVRERPLVGGGLGRAYLFDFSRYGVAPIYKVYIHNNYLWFAQRTGLVGLGLFAWTIVAFFVSGWRARRYLLPDEPVLGGLVVGSRVMLVTLLVISVSSPQFNVKGMVVAMALVMAMAEVAASLLRAEGEVVAATSPSAPAELPGG